MASDHKAKPSTTKSGIPLLTSKKQLPSEYSQDFVFGISKKEAKTEALDEMAEAKRTPLSGPKFVLNRESFSYDKLRVITKNGEFKVRKGITWLAGEEDFATPSDTIPPLERDKTSLLGNILSLSKKIPAATPSQVNKKLTLPIVKEWIRQLMAARNICCYEKDMLTLLHKKSKLEVIQDEFEGAPIFKFELLTDKKLLRRGEKLVNGFCLRYDEAAFAALIEEDELPSSVYILIILNETHYSLNYILDNYHVISYVPAAGSEKEILDEKMARFWKSKKFAYQADEERALGTDLRVFLPLLSDSILQEDFCLLFLRDMLLRPHNYEKDPSYTLDKAKYIEFYTELITEALQLKDEV